MMDNRVLLCDDEPHILRAAEIKLSRKGFDVRTAFDGEQGWEILQTWTPDVLVTDYQMPRLDGLGLVCRCREHEATRELNIIMLTAKGYELSEAELIERYHIHKLLRKPFSPRELVAEVEALLDAAPAASLA